MLHKCLYKLKYGYYKKEVSGYPLTEENSITMPVAQPQISIEKTVANRELAQVLENSLMHIPDHYRVVFILREIEGLPVAETAEVLGITPVNVKVKLNRAKAMLQKELEKRYTRTELFDFHLVYCDKIVSKVMQAIKNLESASPSDVNL
jgi:RNA polymerase sigma-70 factor (ECF subfamily)